MIGRLVLVAAIVSVAPARAVEPPAPLVEYHDDALTARLDNAPLGQVLDALAEATGAEITGPRDDESFTLTYGDDGRPARIELLGEPPPPPPPTKRPPPRVVHPAARPVKPIVLGRPLTGGPPPWFLAGLEIAAIGHHRLELAERRGDCAAFERARDRRREALGLGGAPGGIARLELRHDARRKQLERRADVLVPVVAPLLDEDDLVDARVLEGAEVLAHLVRRADAAAAARHGDLVALEQLPDVGPSGDVSPEQVVVGEGEAEELEAFEPAPQRLVRVVMHAEPGDHGDVGIHALRDRRALAREGLVVVRHPVPGLGDVDEGEGERAEPEPSGGVDHLAVRAGEPHGRVRPLHGLRDDVARRHREVLPGVAGIRALREHERDLRDRLLPHVVLLARVDPEAFELDARRGLAGAELDAPVGDQVEHGDPLRDPRRVVVARRHEHDAVPEADPLRALAARGKKHLGRRGVRVLFQEVMLDLPRVIEAEPIGELHLLERLLNQAKLAALVPRPRELMLVEDPELHAGWSTGRASPRSIAPEPTAQPRCGVTCAVTNACTRASDGVRSRGSGNSANASRGPKRITGRP